MNWSFFSSLNYIPLITGIPGYIALWRSFRNERTKLNFSIYPQEIQNEHGESVCSAIVTVTNGKVRPVTIRICKCKFRYSTSKGEETTFGQTAVDTKIGLGDSFTKEVPLNFAPWFKNSDSVRDSQILSLVTVYAVDSTEKHWKASKKAMRKFRIRARKLWPLEYSNWFSR